MPSAEVSAVVGRQVLPPSRRQCSGGLSTTKRTTINGLPLGRRQGEPPKHPPKVTRQSRPKNRCGPIDAPTRPKRRDPKLGREKDKLTSRP
ncbi:hypothetical protein HNY73_010989 [Argiope bruennichi]|uniref:Uncharacterized protein n=1 Tax=Argiope bruennichi TaxID=94029 RepID=A0A8T0F5A7_ARGBR|nr:hypothetical protein HNY73_010989 [Argiope bruennichi]